MNNTMPLGDSGSSGAAIENLYPALTECFAIIMCGYVAGRMNLITESEAKGINTFVGTFSLPSLIFMSLAKLDLRTVNWSFLLAILIAKTLVFASVIVVTLLVSRPVNMGRAGIFAIFCTQSNDFAVGWPIVDALYKTTHPDYASYLYLMAPISLAILNPVSFVLMEINRRRVAITVNEQDGVLANNNMARRKTLLMIISVAKNIMLNPIIAMTILGILGNFLFRQNGVPCYLGSFLDALGSAFAASALFLLGLRMVGKVHKLRGATLVVPGILIMVKLIMLPLVAREVISIMQPGANLSETIDLSTYGFLYGTFPAAPTVFVFATQYVIDIDLIASAMVACTFISAPLMFVSAKMITITKTQPADYIKQLDAFTFDISIIATVACFWVIIVLVLTKKITRVPHKITACLIISQLLSCMGAILWNTLKLKNGWGGYLQFALFTVGVYSTRLWTAILAVALLFLECRSLCYVLRLQPLFVVIGWGLPMILSTLLLLLEPNITSDFDKRNPNFVYGASQAIVAVALLVFCFIVTVGCLILHQRHRRLSSRFEELSDEVAAAPSTSSPTTVTGLPTIDETCCEDTSPGDIEDLLLPTDQNGGGLCPSRFSCHNGSAPKLQKCVGVVRQYQQQIDDDLELIEEEPESHDPQILRHTVLLILLLGSMFVGLALSIWTLVMDQLSGIYVELSFLDATLNFGQSIIIFGVFGLDTKEVALPLLKLWRKLYYGANTLVLPSWHELSPETRHICDQFTTHHLQNCKSTCAVDQRWRLKVYRGVFTGQRFVDWLIEVGVARDRGEAVSYGRHLIEGKVLRHINGVYHFYDRKLLYTFSGGD